ncbi:MAG: hypothetical protein HYT03_00470 [Candidatus Harrisonbacteria bacterium]|nr:hypothetical protein [Candidatus Harrisonbacteria bacterium]
MTLIKGVKIVDGTGKKEPYQADLLINANKIAAIGKFPNKKADIVIDGLGLYVAPGFIDVNTDSDHHLSLFTNPVQQDFLIQGVTTIFGGLCGSSLAPLIYGGLESVRKWTDITQVNVNWRTVGEFLKILDNLGLGINFGTFIGHSTIRRGLIGDEPRDLSIDELNKFKSVLKENLGEGAFGFSTGLGYALSRRVPYNEIRELAKLVGKAGGIYATHLRNEREGLLSSVEETLKLAKETQTKVIINHFKPIVGFEKEYLKGLELIHEINSEVDIHFDNYPFAESVVTIHSLLPDWAQVGNLEIMLSYLRNEMTRGRLVEEFGRFNGNEIKIAQAVGRDYLVGKTLREFSENQGLSVAEGLIKLMLLTGLRALVIYKNINYDLVVQNLERDRAFIASNGASLPPGFKIFKHERFYNTFPKFLEIVLQRKSLSLPQAIEKITSAPAKKFNLKNRGFVKEESIADLCVFSFKSGRVRVEHVFVNGRLALRDREITGERNGAILRNVKA